MHPQSDEVRVRRTCLRRGLRLEKCARRDPAAEGYGLYRITAADGHPLTGEGYLLTLEEAEEWCRRTVPRHVDRNVSAEPQHGVVRLIEGDATKVLRKLPADAFQACITSPPYFGLREYGVDDRQIGLERTVERYIERLVRVFGEVRRVLSPTGTLWLNIGDCYAGSGGYTPTSPSNLAGSRQSTAQSREYAGARTPPGFRRKNLVGAPWRLAMALQDDGWNLRADIIWHKPNAMPERVVDRPTMAHEYIFLLTKSDSYHYDARAIAEVSSPASAARYAHRSKGSDEESGTRIVNGTRNARSVWTIPTASAAQDHPASMPVALAERCIKAATRYGDEVLDPFAGSGTVGLAAAQQGRQATLIELSSEYAKAARKRLGRLISG